MIKMKEETHKRWSISKSENPIAYLILLAAVLPHYTLVFDQLLGILIVSALLYYAWMTTVVYKAVK